MTKTRCLGDRHYSNTNKITQYETRNTRTKKLVKIIKGICSICARNRSQIFTMQMTRGEDFIKRGKCKKNHCSSMSNSARCDLKNKGIILKVNDKCPNPKYNRQKINTFTPHQYMLEGGSIKSKLQKIFKGTQTAWNKIFKPAVKVPAPFIGMAVSAKSKHPKFRQATTNILQSISGGKTLSLTDLHGNGLRLKKEVISFQINFYIKTDVVKKCSKCKTFSKKSIFLKILLKKMVLDLLSKFAVKSINIIIKIEC